MIPNTLFNYENSKKTLLNHFSVSSLEAYGCSNLDLAIISAGAIISYIKDTQPQSLDIIKKLFTYSTNSFMSIDHYTKRNLELFENVNNSDSQNSLYSILNRTQTPIGSRLLKKFISFPLINVEEINKRQTRQKPKQAKQDKHHKVTLHSPYSFTPCMKSQHPNVP